ncbi:MAG: hypothetical protein PHN26_06120, partial [Eubacteriaceae bacterium]|nr:hypothetical protein [Eubacteriaceae bacterium]
HLDALNIDLKAFTADHYRRLGGDLYTVKTFITRAVHTGCHVELTTLIVPGFNDSAKEISALASWLPVSTRPFPCTSRVFSRLTAWAAVRPRQWLKFLIWPPWPERISPRFTKAMFKSNGGPL